MLEVCPNCYGEGREPGEFDTDPCPDCDGVGRLEEVQCDLCTGKGCPRCDQTGVLYDVPCPTCRGESFVRTPVRCTVCNGWKTIIPEKLFDS